jgi:hypothetical protein
MSHCVEELDSKLAMFGIERSSLLQSVEVMQIQTSCDVGTSLLLQHSKLTTLVKIISTATTVEKK